MLILTVPAAWLVGCAGGSHDAAGRKFRAAGDYDQAVAEFRQAAERHPDDLHIQSQLRQAESDAADDHVAKAERLIKARQLTEAMRHLRMALDYVPAHPEGVTLASSLDLDMAHCEQLMAAARSAANEGEYERAVQYVDEVNAIDLGYPDIERTRAEFRVPQLISAADQATESGRFDEAMQHYDEAQALRPERQNIALRRNEAACRWSESLADEVEARRSGQNVESLWPMCIQALALCSDQSRAAQLARSVENQLYLDSTLKICVVPTTLGQSHRVDSIEVCTKMADALRELVPTLVEVTFPDNLEKARRWIEPNQTDIEEDDRLRKLAGLLGDPDYLLLITLTDSTSPNRIVRHADRRIELSLVRVVNGDRLWSYDDLGMRFLRSANPDLEEKLSATSTSMLSALAHELWQDTVELDTSFVKREAVRFLFTCHTFAPPADRDAAVDLLFDQSAGGPLLDRYREIALARLGAPTDIRVATESTLTEPDLRENEIVETRRAGAPKPKTVDVEPEPRPFIFLKSPKATKVFEGTLSRTGERWSRFATIRNGITITLIDTDVIPLTADLSIHIGRRQITRSDIRIGSRIEFTDDRNSDYRIVISEIDNNTKTIKLDVFEMGK